MGDYHKVHVKVELKDPEGKFFPRIPEFLQAIEQHYEKDVPFDLSLGWPYTHLEQIQRPHFFFSEDFEDAEWFYELLTTEVDRKKLELHREGKVYPDCLQAFFTLVSPFLAAEENQLLGVWVHEDDDFDDRLTYAYVYRGGLVCEVKVPDEPPVKREPVFLGFLDTPPRTVGGIDFIALTVDGEWERLQELLKNTPAINSFGLKEKE
jgi:hypothetical protein